MPSDRSGNTGIFINIDPELWARFDFVRSDLGIFKKAAVVKLIQWLVNQPPQVQRAIFSNGDISAEIVRAAGPGLPTSIDDTLLLAREAVERLGHLAKQYQTDAVQQPADRAKKPRR